MPSSNSKIQPSPILSGAHPASAEAQPLSLEEAERAFDATTDRGKLRWTRWVLARASATDLPTLWERFSNDRITEHLLHHAILARWSQVDPEGGIAYLRDTNDRNLQPFNGRARWALFGLYLAQNYERAETSPQRSGNNQHYGLKFLYGHAGGQFLCENIEPHLEEDSRYRLTGLYDFTRSKPGAALAWAKGLTQPLKRMDAVLSVLEQSDPLAGLDYLAKLPPSDSRKIRREEMLRTLATVDLDAALARVGESEPELINQCVTAHVTKLTESNRFREALRLLPAEEDDVRNNLFGQWVLNDEAASLAFLDALAKEDPHRLSLARSAISSLSESNPAEAWQRLNEMTDPGTYTTPRASAAGNLYRANPEGTVSLVEALPLEEDRLAAWSGIIAVEAERDPLQAMPLVDALPESPAREMAAENVLRRCLSVDRKAAIEWAMQQQPGKTADRMFEQLSQEDSYAQPAESLEWAAAIGDPEQREAAAARVLFDTHQSDEYGLSTNERLHFIDQSSLPEDTKTLLRRRVENQ
ncbi:MAG: hypothetical protein KDN22_25240 [Verrucomicrobiae bacterium]|nr:hypothetical protein [Verrucomicrobiae bacterium]